MGWGKGEFGLVPCFKDFFMYVLFVLGVVEITEFRVYIVFIKHYLHV